MPYSIEGAQHTYGAGTGDAEPTRDNMKKAFLIKLSLQKLKYTGRAGF